MTDDTQDDALRALAAEYHRPPPAPREEIWARIQAERAIGAARPDPGPGDWPPAADVLPFRPLARRIGPAGRALAWVTGVAALLALGIGIGRLTVRPMTPSLPDELVAAIEERSPAERMFAVAMTQFLSRSEAVLTSLRTGETELAFLPAARELLTTTRLLLDAPGLRDPTARDLLEDLELVLAQIAVLPPAGAGDQERLMITAGMEYRNLMPRLRTAIPAGSTVGMYGEL